MIKIDIENSIAPEGFAFTGEYRPPEIGEPIALYYSDKWVSFLVTAETSHYSAHYPILRKLGRWMASYLGEYWIVSEYEVVLCQESGDSIDQARYDSGNYFPTEVAAQECAMLIRDAIGNFWKSKGLDL